MSVAAKIAVKNYVAEEVEEELYAESSTIPATTTTPLKVQAGVIPDGYDAVAVSIACTVDTDSAFFLKKKDKQVYSDGLNTGGLGGLLEETLLLVKLKAKEAWEVGFTNTSGSGITMDWRFRIRLFPKE